MKTTMKKVLSLILTAAMLLSVALTATVATSAEDSNEKFNAYIEWQNAAASSVYQGIAVDGTKSTVEAQYNGGVATGYIGNNLIAGTFAEKISFGASYTASFGSNSWELHMNLLAEDGSEITDIYVAVGGEEFYINKNWSSAWTWKGTDLEAGSWADISSYKRVEDTYYEWMIPMELIRLEKVYAEDNYSTDLTITVTTSNDTYTKTGRLVFNESFHPNVTHFGTHSISSTSTTSIDSGNTHDSTNKVSTLSLTATSDGAMSSLCYNTGNQNDNSFKYWKMVPHVAWEYNLDLTVSDLPAIAEDATVVIPCNSGKKTTATPCMVLCLTDMNAALNGCLRKLTVGIYNKNGTLYIASSTNTNSAVSNQVSLGVAPSDTSFKLTLIWNLDYTYTVFVNGVEKGTVNAGNNGQHWTSGKFATNVRLYAGADFAGQKLNFKIENFTVGNSFYGIEEGLLANSATPNYVPAIKFYQTSAVDNGTYNVRLIATVDKALVDAGDMTVAGFNVAASKTNAEGTVNGTTKAHRVYEVYNSITASGETVNAPEGTYFMVFTIKNIPAADTLTLNFSAFAETETAAYVEGSVFTLTFENGARKN